MDGWILVLIVVAIALGMAFWAVRHRSRGSVGSAMPGVVVEPIEDAGGQKHGLAVLEFEGEPGRVEVTQAEVVIGRHSGDDIQVRDVRVSRHHARLVARRDGGFEIHNLTAVRSEPNPMQINGVTREHAQLQDGDVVSLGGVNFTLWLKAA